GNVTPEIEPTEPATLPPTLPVTLETEPMFEPTKAKPLAAPGALRLVKRLLPIDADTVKSPEVVSCQRADAIAVVVRVLNPEGNVTPLILPTEPETLD